jgi:hypothetical protein
MGGVSPPLPRGGGSRGEGVVVTDKCDWAFYASAAAGVSLTETVALSADPWAFYWGRDWEPKRTHNRTTTQHKRLGLWTYKHNTTKSNTACCYIIISQTKSNTAYCSKIISQNDWVLIQHIFQQQNLHLSGKFLLSFPFKYNSFPPTYSLVLLAYCQWHHYILN